jgi:hypothetical protein
MANNFMRGALIQFMPTFLIPLPNVIVFQFNPETMTHTWSQPESTSKSDSEPCENPTAVRGLPGESFSFTIAMDAGEMIAEGSVVAEGIAVVSGIYSRLAALEMLLYPLDSFEGGLLGSVSVSAGGLSAGGSAASVERTVPQSQVPLALFVWGPGRIVPVRVTTLKITEKLYDGFLNPTHAEAELGLRVLTPKELADASGPLKDIAKGAYYYSHGLRQALAVANLANSVESIIGMLPV